MGKVIGFSRGTKFFLIQRFLFEREAVSCHEGDLGALSPSCQSCFCRNAKPVDRRSDVRNFKFWLMCRKQSCAK